MEERVKSAATTDPNLNKLIPAWKGLRSSVPFFGPIRNERDYQRMQGLMDELLGVVGADEDHPLADLLDVIGMLVAQYEDENTPELLASSKPLEILQFLMEQHGLKQADLRKEIGTQGVVSEILSGSRQINARQAKALARRFGVSPAVFL
jgi:HTH-type transcriptional regulator / antitoxin HigA